MGSEMCIRDRASILSSISTVKSESKIARLSTVDILNPSTTAFFFPFEVCFKRDIVSFLKSL